MRAVFLKFFRILQCNVGLFRFVEEEKGMEARPLTDNVHPPSIADERQFHSI